MPEYAIVNPENTLAFPRHSNLLSSTLGYLYRNRETIGRGARYAYNTYINAARTSGGLRGQANGTATPARVGQRRTRDGMATPRWITPMPGTGGNTAVVRYKAHRLVQKKGKGATKHRAIKYAPNPMTLARMDMPFVRWKMLGPTTPEALTSAVGKQGLGSNTDDIDGWNQMCNRNLLQQIYRKLYTDIAYQHSMAANQPAWNNTIVQNMPDLACHGYTRELHLLNPLNTVTYFELWVCVKRKPQFITNNGPLKDWEDELVRATSNTPGAYGLNMAKSNETEPTTNSIYDVTDPGRRPYKPYMEDWHKEWKVIEKVKYKLEPTSSTTHRVVIPGFKLSHKELFDDAVTSCISNVTAYLFPFIIGEKCYDNAVGHQRVSYNAGKVTITFSDTTAWSIRRRGQLKLDFETNYFDDWAAITPVRTSFHEATEPITGTTAGSAIAAETAPGDMEL